MWLWNDPNSFRLEMRNILSFPHYIHTSSWEDGCGISLPVYPSLGFLIAQPNFSYFTPSPICFSICLVNSFVPTSASTHTVGFPISAEWNWPGFWIAAMKSDKTGQFSFCCAFANLVAAVERKMFACWEVSTASVYAQFTFAGYHSHKARNSSLSSSDSEEADGTYPKKLPIYPGWTEE